MSLKKFDEFEFGMDVTIGHSLCVKLTSMIEMAKNAAKSVLGYPPGDGDRAGCV